MYQINYYYLNIQLQADQEETVYNQLTELLKYTESEEGSKFDKDINLINELIKVRSELFLN